MKCIYVIAFTSLIFFQCKEDCEFIRSHTVDSIKTELFQCYRNHKVMTKRITYVNDTLQGIITWEQGNDSLKFLKTYHRNGQISAEWKEINGKGEGFVKCWHSNGAVQKKTFVHKGNFHGKIQEWDKNGRLSYTGNFKHGKKEGKHINYLVKGEFVEEHYSQDSLHGGIVEKRWNEDEEKFLICVGQYENGIKTGKWMLKDEAGNIKNLDYYKNGKLHGILERYYDNGAIKLKTEYVNHEITGEYKYWNEEGELEEYKIYEKGNLIQDKMQESLKKL